MYDSIYLKNISKKEIIAILNRDENSKDNSIIQIFEKLSNNYIDEEEKEIINENFNQKINQNINTNTMEKNTIPIKQKFNKFQTEKNNFYFSIKDNLFAGITTKETSNEKIYNDILYDILNEEKFRIRNDIRNNEKIKEILEFYVSKHFIDNNNYINKNLKGNYLQLKNLINENDIQSEKKNSSNLNNYNVNVNDNDNDNENNKENELNLDLYFPEENDINKSQNVIIPTNYVMKKNCKLIFFLIFILIGIALASVIIYILV
jgi:hypothetical protein